LGHLIEEAEMVRSDEVTDCGSCVKQRTMIYKW